MPAALITTTVMAIEIEATATLVAITPETTEEVVSRTVTLVIITTDASVVAHVIDPVAHTLSRSHRVSVTKSSSEVSITLSPIRTSLATSSSLERSKRRRLCVTQSVVRVVVSASSHMLMLQSLKSSLMRLRIPKSVAVRWTFARPS